MLQSIKKLIRRSISTPRRKIIFLQVILVAIASVWLQGALRETIMTSASKTYNTVFGNYEISFWVIFFTIGFLFIREINRVVAPPRCNCCGQKVKGTTYTKTKLKEAQKKIADKLDTMLPVEERATGKEDTKDEERNG